jgi:hypothetical protein
MGVTGSNFVRFTRHGLQSARAAWTKTGDRFEVRRQALKLRFWDERHEHPPGMLFDHTYESIKALKGLGIYELRLDDEIGGHENIRVIFFDPPSDWVPVEKKPMRVIWILEIFPKKRDEFTRNDLNRFRASRLLLAQRCYGK